MFNCFATKKELKESVDNFIREWTGQTSKLVENIFTFLVPGSTRLVKTSFKIAMRVGFATGPVKHIESCLFKNKFIILIKIAKNIEFVEFAKISKFALGYFL